MAIAVRVLDLEAAADPRVSQRADTWPTWQTLVVIVLALMLIVWGSVGVVQAAVTLAGAWKLSQAIMGTLILAGLTSLPNAYAAVRLARRGRGAALVSETFNSNTINLVVGVAVPVIVLGLSGTLGGVTLDLIWLVAMTIVTVCLLAWHGGLTRLAGLAIIGLYVLFVLVRVT